MRFLFDKTENKIRYERFQIKEKDSGIYIHVYVSKITQLDLEVEQIEKADFLF